MFLLFQISTVVILIMIFVQDIKSRAVYWVLFPLLAFAFVGSNYAAQTLTGYWRSPLINIGFVIFQLLLLTAWFSIRQKKLVDITNGLLGWGDVLFLICLAFCFSFINFLLFYIVSLIVVLITWVSFRKNFFKNTPHIPLAGLQAMLLGIVLVWSWCTPGRDLTSDEWAIKLLMTWN